MNYNSRGKKYTEVKRLKTKIKKSIARFLRFYNWGVKDISNILRVSPNRVYQYLRD